MSTHPEYLYHLLPTLYRLRDRAQGEPLRALLAVLETEYQRLAADLDRLYDNWFIETCDEWVVPYIGDLLGVSASLPLQGSHYSQRAFVANTLAYRRAKGTAIVLEQLARDVTGWSARVVEGFERLVTSQFLNHVRLSAGATVDLRQSNLLEQINSPFETATHTIDVRHIDRNRGRYNIPNVGIFLWRLQSYFLARSTARSSGVPGCYTFSPLGYSQPLFNRPRSEVEIAQIAAEANVPVPLRRLPLHSELEALRRGQEAGPRVYFSQQPVVQVFVEGHEVPLKQLFIAHLDRPDSAPPGNWYRPLPIATGQSEAEVSQLPAAIRPIRVGLDPVRGRLVVLQALDTGPEPYLGQVEVSYAAGFSGDLGGGPYNRQDSLASWYDPQRQPVTWQLGVTQDPLEQAATPDQMVSSLGEAIQRWNAYVATAEPIAKFGLIVLLDNRTDDLTAASQPVPDIQLPAHCQLAIGAARWPAIEDPTTPGRQQRLLGTLIPAGRRPHLLGDLAIQGSSPGEGNADNGLILDGVLLEGKLTVRPGNLEWLQLTHSTLVPSAGGLSVAAAADQQNQNLSVRLSDCISGPLSLADSVPQVTIQDSIIDNGQGGILADAAIDAPGTALQIQASTILGTTQGRTIEASNSLFIHPVRVDRRQTGCVRFSYVPLDSLVPRRFRCHPADGAAARLVPQFTTVVYGSPGYAQLTPTNAAEILAAADDQGELGAFHRLQHSQRLKNLQQAITEYLRFGVEAGIFLLN